MDAKKIFIAVDTKKIFIAGLFIANYKLGRESVLSFVLPCLVSSSLVLPYLVWFSLDITGLVESSLV